MYFNPMDATRTRTPVRAWVETAKALVGTDNFHLGGVVVHIERPHVMPPEEVDVIRHVDGFLRQHGQYPVSTVANTIFPAALDRGDGVQALTKRYMENFPRMPRKGWGRYFERFVHWPDERKGGFVNQLAANIEMLNKARTGTFHTDKYELVVSDPTRRMRSVQGRNCLSLVELKPEKATNMLHVHATYRNSHYIRKTLGNILGIAELQAFIAREAGFQVGTLTMISTSGHLETNQVPWGKKDIRDLIEECDQALVTQQAA